MRAPNDIHDDNSWVKAAPACWVYGSRFTLSWTDPRMTFGLSPVDAAKGGSAAIRCIGPDQWVVYIYGEDRVIVESWNEAKEVAALLLGVEDAT